MPVIKLESYPGLPNFLKSFKCFFCLLRVSSVSIEITHASVQPEPHWCKVYRMILIGIAVFHLLPIVNVASGHWDTFTPLFYCDNVLNALLLVSYWVNYPKICSLFNELLIAMWANQDSRSKMTVLESTRRCSWALIFAGTLYSITIFALNTSEVLGWDDETLNYVLKYYYCITSIPRNYRKLILLPFEYGYYLMTVCVYVFFAFVALVIFMLFCCFQQLNQRLQFATIRSFNEFRVTQVTHHHLANLVVKTNECFSPTLFFIVLFKCIEIIFGVAAIKRALHHYHDIGFNDAIKFSVLYLNAAGIVFFLTFLGGKMQLEAQKTLEIFLKISLQNPEMYNNIGLTSISKMCHITTLFTSQRVAITASNFFTINYNLLALIVSSTITYITLLT